MYKENDNASANVNTNVINTMKHTNILFFINMIFNYQNITKYTSKNILFTSLC